MEKRMLGKTGFKIAPAMFGGIVNKDETQEDANRYVAYAVERGVNYFDVAPSYGNSEEKLGEALKPYRKDVYLACKTLKRDAKGAKEELLASLEHLQTDYFDVYQLHHVQPSSDVDEIFAEGGAMETLLWAKREGLVRKLGITAHTEECALQCLELFDFDVVLFTLYWVPGVLRGVGDRLAAVARARDIGYLAMKALTHRVWRDDELKPHPKKWYKHVDFGSPLALAVMKYCLSKGATSLVGPGVFDALCYMIDNIGEAIANPLNSGDLELLKQEAKLVGDLELKLEAM